MANSPKKKGRYLSEEEQLEQSYRKITGNRPAKKKKRGGRVFAWILCICLIIAGLFGTWWYYSTFLSDPYIFRNVYAAGVSLGGLTREEAAEALQVAASRYETETMSVTVMDSTVTLLPVDTGAELDVDALVKDAFLYGKLGTSSQKEEAKLQAEQYGYYLEAANYLNLDTDYIQAEAERLGYLYNQEFSPSGYEVIGSRPELNAENLNQPCETLVLTIGSPQYGLNTKALYNHILAAYNRCEFVVEETCEYLTPEKLDLDAIYQEFYIAPSDALMNPETYEVTQDTYGYDFDLASAKAQLSGAHYGDVLEIPFRVLAPEITTQSLSSLLYRDELASVSTKHTDNEDRNTNLRLACEAIDGTVLFPGEEFSYNEALGERTEEQGYRPGASYAGGEVVYTYGGGICQVSSSLYYAALIADLEITERDCHMFPPSYIPYGMDATVNWGTIDFRFKNSTSYPLRIEAGMADGCVNVTLIGTDEKSYYVEMEYEIDETYSWKTVYKDYPADNEQGYTNGQILSYPADGYGISTYRCKYDKETKELISRDYETFSSYDPQDQEVCRIDGQSSNPDSGSGSGGYGPIGEATG